MDIDGGSVCSDIFFVAGDVHPHNVGKIKPVKAWVVQPQAENEKNNDTLI